MYFSGAAAAGAVIIEVMPLDPLEYLFICRG